MCERETVCAHTHMCVHPNVGYGGVHHGIYMEVRGQTMGVIFLFSPSHGF